jgi:hypothetical protein
LIQRYKTINKQQAKKCGKEDGRSVAAASGGQQQRNDGNKQWLGLWQMWWQPRQRWRAMAKMRSTVLLMMAETAEARATAAHGGQDDSILSAKLIRIAPEISSF